MSDHIPSGVMREILGCLSPWELGRWRCANKEWRSMIDDPDFIQRQRRRFTSLFFLWHKQPNFLRFTPGTFGPGRGPLNLTHDWDQPSSLYPPSVSGPTIMGSYHGLLCLGFYPDQLLLFNPAFPDETRLATLVHFMKSDPVLGNLFESDSFQYHSFNWDAYGFGYDKVARDYKAVILVSVHEPGESQSYILTYRFGTKSLSFSPINKFLYVSSCQRLGVLLRGDLIWIAGDYEIRPDLIYSFDLGADSITEFRQPEYGGGEEDRYWFKSVGVVDSCLAVCASFRGRLDVWVMKEYGKEDSWCRLYSVVNPLFDGGKFIYSGSLNGHILLSDTNGFIWVEPSRGTVQVVDRPVGYNYLMEAHLCLESTVRMSPHGESSGL